MATVPKPIPSVTDEHMLRAIAPEFIRYHDERNIDKLVDLFTEDGRILAPFRPSVQENTGLRESFRRAFDEFDQRALKVDTTHVEVCGDVAFSIGTFKVNMKMPNGKRIDDQGKWIVAARRVGKTWKIAAHCWNTDLPITSFIT